MQFEKSRDPDPCVVPGVQPFLNELRQRVVIRIHGDGDPERAPVEAFIRRVFLHSYDARLNHFYPTLLAFHSGRRLRAALGLRDAAAGSLFAEHYLPSPAETLVAAHWSRVADRRQLVEVGNLALAGAGEARWVIAAVTTFLHACGYRWVLFTAVRTLFNAFRRLGLNPIPLAAADPGRLPDGGRQWGRYYDERPMVCVGDIQSGYRKLSGFVSHGQPMLRALLDEAHRQAATRWCGNQLPVGSIR
jgi:hypothetical protein